MSSPLEIQFHVGPSEHGRRLDSVVRQRVRQVSRALLNRWFSAGGIVVDGRRARKGQIAYQGQHVQVVMDPLPIAVAAEGNGLRILFETPDLVALDKPAGQPSTALDSSDRNAVVNALLDRYPETATIGYSPRDAGLVHRLDTGTSGVLVAAKHAAAFQELRLAQEQGRLRKSYLALVYTHPQLAPQGRIDVPLRSAGRRVVAAAPTEHGAHACQSEYRVLARGSELTLVELYAARAYRHQLRAHCALLGIPLAGDLLYGASPHPQLTRHALHAHRITFEPSSASSTPRALARFEVVAPLPDDLRSLCQAQALPWPIFPAKR